MGDVGKAVGKAVGAGAAIVTGGLYNPRNGSISTRNALNGGVITNGFGLQAEALGMGGLFGGGQKSSSGDKAMANAMIEQARATTRAADISAKAARDVAQMNLKGMEKQANASMYAAQQSAMGGIIGAALGANTTTEQIKQWLPHESGAATIASWELGEKWNTTLRMKQEGYSDVAIEYALSGKNFRSLYKDSQWNAMRMGQMAKQDGISNIQMFGIKSASNPFGVPVTEDEFIQAHALKDPEALLHVDPAQANARLQAFANWERDMRAKGLGLMVDIYKNPQLAGSHLKAMQGKEALLDPSLAPLVGAMNPGNVPGAPGGGTNWNQVISALTKGEQNPMTAQVEKLKEMGIIDKYGMVNAGGILQHIPPELQNPLEFNPYRELSQQDIMRLKDQYKQFSEITVDPKLIKEENLGYGVTRKVKLNADGTIAGHMMEGYMTDAQGNQMFMTMPGTRLQEWYDRQSMISGMGPLFPGILAPATSEELSGRFEPGFWGDNVAAKPNNGAKGKQPQGALPTTMANPYGESAAKAQPKAKTNIAPTNVTPDSSGPNPAASAGGAPLAAGG